MKKTAYLSLACALTCLSSFAIANESPKNTKSWEAFSQDINIVHLQDLTDETLKEIMEGKHPQLAVEFTAGNHLPISFYLKGDLANLVESNENFGTIEIKQTFYARCIGEELILSSNSKEWKPFLEFITGTTSVALSIQDGQPSIIVGSETNRRN